MKRAFLIMVVMALFSPVWACAMGPIYTGPKIAVWDPVEGATGYFVYWRSPGNQTWSTRLTASGPGVDLTAAVPQGAWEICVTSFDGSSESGPSNVVTWSYTIRAAPANAKVQ